MGIVLGPIVGAVDQTSAKVWLKTDRPAQFSVKCADESGNGCKSETVEATLDADYAAVAELSGLSGDTEYRYSVYCDGEQFESPNFRFKTAPVGTSDFWFVFGSCFRPLVRYTFVMRELYRRLTEPTAQLPRPSFMLLLGDQIYADQSGVFPDKPNWQAGTFEDYCNVYLETWRYDQWFLRSLSQLPTMMIFDDHEVVNDWFKNHRSVPGIADSDRKVTGGERLDNALRAYRIYQASRNPIQNAGFEYSYQSKWGDAYFYVIDARSLRRVWPPWRRDILGDNQFGALAEWLELHRADLKFVVTSVPISYVHVPTLVLTICLPAVIAALIFASALAVSVILALGFVAALLLEYMPFGVMDQWPGFNWGRKRLLRFIHRRKIGNLVFLAGDLHISNFIELRARDGNAPPIYQFTSSPVANETKLNFLHRRIMFKDWIPFYRMAQKSVFTESSLGTVVVRHPTSGGCVLEYGLIAESGAWKRMSRPITFT